jgi:hypothetical protein
MSWTRYAAQWGDGNGSTTNRLERRALRKPLCSLEDNIKMDLKEVECVGMYCIQLSLHRVQWRALVSRVIILRVQLKADISWLSDYKNRKKDPATWSFVCCYNYNCVQKFILEIFFYAQKLNGSYFALERNSHFTFLFAVSQVKYIDRLLIKLKDNNILCFSEWAKILK